jgi:hypothetical protein
LNGKIAKDKFCISRWIQVPLSSPRNRVYVGEKIAYPGPKEKQKNQEQGYEPTPPLADAATDDRAS